MAITINLTPKDEEFVSRCAAQSGMNINDYLMNVARREVIITSSALNQTEEATTGVDDLLGSVEAMFKSNSSDNRELRLNEDEDVIQASHSEELTHDDISLHEYQRFIDNLVLYREDVEVSRFKKDNVCAPPELSDALRELEPHQQDIFLSAMQSAREGGIFQVLAHLDHHIATSEGFSLPARPYRISLIDVWGMRMDGFSWRFISGEGSDEADEELLAKE